jgi:hypothetical protein
MVISGKLLTTMMKRSLTLISHRNFKNSSKSPHLQLSSSSASVAVQPPTTRRRAMRMTKRR